MYYATGKRGSYTSCSFSHITTETLTFKEIPHKYYKWRVQRQNLRTTLLQTTPYLEFPIMHHLDLTHAKDKKILNGYLNL